MPNVEQIEPESGVLAGQTKILRGLLQGLLGLVVLATGLSVLVNGREALTLEELALNLVMAGVLLLGLWLLSRGRFKSVVWLVAGSLFLAAAGRQVGSGIEGLEANLLVFVAPITLVGLLLGRRELYLMAGLSLAVVLAVFGLERAGSPLVGRDAADPEASSAVVIFALVTGLLLLFLDRFALTLHDALTSSVAREDELRREVDERVRLETRLRLASEAARVGVWSWNAETNETEWSDTMRELFGVPFGAPVTLDTFMERIHPEDRDRMRQETAQAYEAGESTYRVVLPDGRVRWLVGRGQFVMGHDGKRRMMGAAFDITPIKEAEAERMNLLVKEQDARREAELHSSQLSFLADASHILAGSLDYKETLAQLARLAVPKLADWCVINVLNDEGLLEPVTVAHSDPEKVRWAEQLQQRYPTNPNAETGPYNVLRTGKPEFLPEITDEILAAAAQDERHLEMLREVGFSSALSVPMKSRDRTLGVLSLVSAKPGERFDEKSLDLTMQLAQRAAVAVDNARLYGEAQVLNAELEERVAARTAQLQELNQELESFTYSASHDLRGPLRGINGYSQALLEDYGEQLDDTARSYLQRVSAGATRMGVLIDDLLSLSRIGRTDVRVENVDLSALARSVVEDLRERDPERSIKVDIAEGLDVHGDAGLLRIVLENLLVNAWKFTQGREPACVEVGLSDSEGDTEAAFFVRDNGAGFDMRFADKLFIPFQRLHGPDKYEGSGIGLATAQRIIKRHGGQIWAEGQEDGGATFYFTLPESAAPGEYA